MTAASTPQPQPATLAGMLRRRSDGQPRGRVTSEALLWACEQLAVTEEAGVPLYRALGMLAKMRSTDAIGRYLGQLQADISEGASLAEAMRAQPKVWPPAVIALVSAGEASGALEQAFTAAAQMVEGQQKLRSKLRTALAYPTVVLSVAVVLVATLLLVVVPNFEEIYDTLGGQLPAVTQSVIAASEVAPALVAGFGLLVAATVGLLVRSRTDRTLALQVERVRYRLPLLGRVQTLGVHARVAATLSSLLDAGVPLLEALDFAGDTAGSETHRRSLQAVKDQVSDGASLADALAADGLWPEQLVQLIAVGEETGRLTGTMRIYARRAQEEVEQATETLTSMVEPLMMVVIGAIVGVFLLALYLPLVDLGAQIQ